MKPTKHAPWYGAPNTERFEFRVPKGFKKSLANHLLFHNRTGRAMRSQSDFILTAISKLIAEDIEVVDNYLQTFSKR